MRKLILLISILFLTSGCTTTQWKAAVFGPKALDRCYESSPLCLNGADAACIAEKKIRADKEAACRARREANKPIIIEQCEYDEHGNKKSCTKTTKRRGQ